jgi:hypothetical protein
MDFRLVLPTRLDIEVNGFNGGLLDGIPSSYSHYISRMAANGRSAVT